MLLFPAELFELDKIPSAAAEQFSPAAESVSAAATEATPPAAPAAAESLQEPTAATAAAPTGPPLVLVISDESGAAQNVAEILSSANYECKVMNFQEDLKPLLSQNQVLGAFLIMSQVNEKGFATAIKLQSGDQPLPPVIFAGPEWTRSTVLRAIKYGAHDILVMPASGEEIQEKISQHFRKAS
jgi:PleD family two-component response regulator